MTATTAGLPDWQSALVLLLVFVLVVLAIIRMGRDPNVKRVRFGVFVERELHDESVERHEWPRPRDDEHDTLAK